MSKGTILVADDSPTQQKLICAPFQANGYEVICAKDGCEALAAVEKGSQLALGAGRGDAEHERFSGLQKDQEGTAGTADHSFVHQGSGERRLLGQTSGRRSVYDQAL